MGRIKKSIEVAAPLEACYRVWIDLERYPLFMKHVEQVRRKGDPNVWQWTLKGPNGKTLHWDSELDASKHDNRVISWHTVRDADVCNSGAITLDRLDGNRGTRIQMVVEYSLPGASEQEMGDSFSGYVDTVVQEGLEHFKTMIEQQQMAKTAIS